MQFIKNNNKNSPTLHLLKFLLAIFITSISLPSIASDSHAPLKFQQFSTEQGLSQSSVYTVGQDQQGFIWLGTQDGLNRYDGSEFVQYRNELSNPASLANNFVRVILVDSENVMWVGTQNGLSKYNAYANSFENYFHIKDDFQSLKDNTIWSIFEDHNKNIFIATANGLHKYNKDNNNFERIYFKNFAHEIKEIKTIFEDSNNNIWLGTYENGLFILNESNSLISSINGKNKWKLNITSNSIFEIKEIENKIWVATENGVFVVDHSYKLNKQFLPTNYDSNVSLDSNRVRTIERLDDEYIWFGTEGGLFELNLSKDEIYKKRTTTQVNESANIIFSIFTDKSNSIWIANIYNGVSRYNKISSLFKHQLFSNNTIKTQVIDFAEFENGNLWIATENSGLYYQPINSNKLIKSEFYLEQRISSIHADINDLLWIITQTNELFEYNIKTNELTEHVGWLDSYSDKHGRTDFTFLNGDFWFGSQKSALIKYTPKNKKLTTFPIGTEIVNVFAIGVNNKNKIWVYATNQKLYLFDSKINIFQEYKIPFHNFFTQNSLTLVQENQNHLWFSFQGQGILLLDKKNKKYTEFNENNGLKNNFISGLLIDDTGKAWVSSNKGISRLDPYSKTSTNYGVNQGIMSEDFFAFSFIKTQQGELFFGGVDGFNSFYPSDIKSDSEIITKPINNNFLVENKKLLIDSSNDKDISSLKGNLFLLSNVNLKYQDTPFSIEFTSPNSTFSKEVNYKYKLEGVDDHWIYTNSSNRRATYTKLPHGEYTFKLQALNSKNDEFKAASPLKIIISPPWWLTNTAWLFYFLILSSLVYYFIRQAKNKEKTNIQIKESEERLKLALWGSGDEMWDWNMVTNQMYRSNIWGTLDFPKEGSKDDGSEGESHNIHPQDHARVKETLEAHKADKTEHYEAAYRVKNKEGKWIWVLDRGKVVERDNNNAPIRMTGTLKDISQIKQTEENLKLFAKCIENISDAVVVYDSQFQIVDCNLSFQRITGQNRTEALGNPLEFNSYPISFLQNLKKNLIHHGSWQGEIESTRSNGEDYLIDITLDIIRDENEKISHFVGVFSDITERRETEEELRKLANSDTLTGLPNRSFFQANQSQLVSQETEHALLVFDLDNFKKINDSLGHQIGDVLLCKVTERIATVSNLKNTCYRLGGDEFSLIIEGNNDIHNITSIADEILNVIAEPYFIRNQEIALSCSIGIALFPDDGGNSHELLKNADTAMYHAKDKGGDTYQFFNDSMNKQAVKRLQIENLIRHGLKEDLFSVYYQPKIDVKSGKIRGMEALVRFEAGQKGIIRPDIFIPISEETGQIIEIGEVVLRKACLATKAWIDNGMFKGRIAVNLSAVQFRQPNLVQIINEVLEETKLPAKFLELEITEGTVMDSPQEAIETMLQIRKLGIHLSLDDFGTGYSSLAYLKKFPLNTLKIDKAFVDDLEESEEGRNMVATIITIAHNLGMDVVAEGVETESQLNHLKALNCEQLQGYLYSRPLSEEDFGRYLLSHIITNKSTPYSNI